MVKAYVYFYLFENAASACKRDFIRKSPLFVCGEGALPRKMRGKRQPPQKGRSDRKVSFQGIVRSKDRDI